MTPIPTLCNYYGFSNCEPVFILSNLNARSKPEIKSRVFGTPYSDFEEEIGWNLYSWLHQSFEVLWRVIPSRNEIIIFQNTCNKLADRFATLLKISKEDAKDDVYAMVKSLSRTNFFIEKIIYGMEGNWILKNWNAKFNGLLEYFLFYLAWMDIDQSSNGTRSLDIFNRKFACDVDLSLLKTMPQEKVFSGFVQCFYRNSNDINRFKSFLAES